MKLNRAVIVGSVAAINAALIVTMLAAAIVRRTPAPVAIKPWQFCDFANVGADGDVTIDWQCATGWRERFKAGDRDYAGAAATVALAVREGRAKSKSPQK